MRESPIDMDLPHGPFISWLIARADILHIPCVSRAFRELCPAMQLTAMWQHSLQSFGLMPLLGSFGQQPALSATTVRHVASPRTTPKPSAGSRSSWRSGASTRPPTRAQAKRSATTRAQRSRRAPGQSTAATRSRRSGVAASAKVSSSTTVTSRRVDLPATFKIALDTWGPKLRSVVEQVCVDWPRSSGVPVHFRSFFAKGLRLGTDCSGAEAPVWALRGLGVAFEHVFSCDSEPVVREFVRANSPPLHTLFSDMLRRPIADIPDVDIYVCGFPCTPYSLLRGHDAKLFQEKATKPYFEILKVLRQKKPALAILENVIGLGRVVGRVLRDLQSLRLYDVVWMKINSEDLGVPVARPRYYFLLIRYDACIFNNMADIADFCAKCLGAACSPVREHIANRMLPNDHPEVLAFLSAAAKKRPGGATGSKWQQKHKQFQQQQVPVFRGCPQSKMPLASARQQEVWALLRQRAGTNDLIADVSQSIDRGYARTDGVCPTITPRGILCIGVLNRPVIPIEKLALHGFPIHRMSIPSSVSNEALGKMGGNTMHLHSVRLELLLGISLLQENGLAERPDAFVKAQFVAPSFPAKRAMSQTTDVNKQARLS